MENQQSSDFQQKSVLGFNLKILEIFGLWSAENKSKYVDKIQKAYKFIMISSFSLHLLCQIMDIVHIGNVSILVTLERIYIPALSVALFIKIWCITKNDKRIHALVDSMDQEIFKPRNSNQTQLVKNYTNTMGIFFRMFIMFSVLTWTLFYVGNMKSIKQRTLPIAGVYPYEEELFLVYFVYQSFEELLISFCNVSVDCIIIGFLCHMRMQLDLLNQNLRNIKRLSIEKLRKRDKKLSKSSDYLEELQNVVNETLVECIKHYETILK